MAGLTVQNFLSAATGIAVAFALMRGFANRSLETLGNAARPDAHHRHVLLPISLLMALFLSAGSIQNFEPYHAFTTLEGAANAAARAGSLAGSDQNARHQRRRFLQRQLGASVRKPDGTDQLCADAEHLPDPGRAVFCLWSAAGRSPSGHMLLWAMSIMFVLAVVAVMWAELRGNPHFLTGADSAINMEGKETRFGILNSSLFAVITTAASCGAVNAMHDSFTALGGMVPMWLMQLGEVVFGGVGAGLYGMLLFVLLGVFIAGLMIGRTPEYMGKRSMCGR